MINTLLYLHGYTYKLYLSYSCKLYLLLYASHVIIHHYSGSQLLHNFQKCIGGKSKSQITI